MTLPVFSKSLLIALVATFATLSLHAQTEAAPVKAPKPAPRAEQPKEGGENLAKELNLTEEQKAQFKKADDDFAAKRKAAKSDKSADMKALREERMKAHKAALTPEQAKKYDEIQAKKEAKRAEMKQRKMEGKEGRKEMKEGKKEEKAAKKERKEERKAIKEELKKQ